MKTVFKIILILNLFHFSLFSLSLEENRITSFLYLLYENILGREADRDGILFWESALYDQNQTAVEVTRYFFLSKELKEQNLSNEEYISRVYRTLLAREPDKEGFEYWLDMLENKKIPRLQLFYRFVFSKEFEELTLSHEIFPYNKKDLTIAFIERFYNLVLQRDSDQFGLNYWYEVLHTAKKNPKEITKDFFYSKEFLQRDLTDKEFIEIAYRTLLNREADEEGLSFWLNKIKNGYSRDEVLDNFLDSYEFKTITDRFLKKSTPVFVDKFPPSFNLPFKVTVGDNQKEIIKLKAFDRSRPIRFEIEGEDGKFFGVDGDLLIEKEKLVFREPKDSNQDNIYEISIKAFDAKGNFVTKKFVIEVCPDYIDKKACLYGLYVKDSLSFGAHVNGVLKSGDLLFGTDKYGGLFVFQDENGSFKKVSRIEIDDFLMDMGIYKNYLFVLGGKRGVRLIDVNDSNNLKNEGIIIDNLATKLFIDRNYLFLSDSSGDVEIYDIQNPKKPIYLNSFSLPYGVSSIYIKDNKAFISANEGGVYIFDVKDLKNIKEVAHIDTNSTIKDVLVYKNFAYFAAFDEGVNIFDVSDIKSPKFIKNIKLDSKSVKLSLKNDYLFVADLYAGLKVVDILNPKEAKVVGYVSSGETLDIWIDKYTLYLAGGEGIDIVDILNPITKDIVSKVYIEGAAYKIALDKDKVFLADFRKNLDVVAIKDPENPILLKTLDISFKEDKAFSRDKEGDIFLGLNDMKEDYINDIVIYKDYILLAKGLEGVEILNKADLSVINFIKTKNSSQSIFIYDDMLYVAAENEILLFDISDMFKPKLLSTYRVNFSIDKICIDSDILVAVSEDGNLEILKVENGSLRFGAFFDLKKRIFDISIKDGYLFLAEGEEGIEIFDPDKLKIVKSIKNLKGYARDVEIYGNFLFSANLYEGIEIFDISKVLEPKFFAKADLYGVLGVKTDGEFLYAVDFNTGLNIIDISSIKNKSFLIKKRL